MTIATACVILRHERGLSHRFHPESGWCVYGCGNRDDGRVISRGGTVVRSGVEYKAPDLLELAERSTA